MPINQQRYGVSHLNPKGPDLMNTGFNPDSLKENTVFFIGPQPHRRISLQGLRANHYNFSDQFINETSEFLSRALRNGSQRGLNSLLKSDEAIHSVSINDQIDSVIDLNPLKHDWKFILYLNTFANTRANLGIRNTVIITGRCADGEAPFKDVGSQRMWNENCDLIMESRSVFRSGDLGKITTSSSVGYGYQEQYRAAADQELLENKPGSMNFQTEVDEETSHLKLGASPINVVGQYGPTTFNRAHHLPGMALKNTMTAINKTFRDKERKSISPLTDYEAGIPSLRMNDRSVKYPTLVENLQSEERGQALWSLDQFGPQVGERLLASMLESEYGVKNVIVIGQDAATMWCGYDQTEISLRALWETQLEKVLPTLMIEYQLARLSFEIIVEQRNHGEVHYEERCSSIAPTIVGMPREELDRRYNAIIDELLDSLFPHILGSGGDFRLNAQINITSTSSLALDFLSDGLEPDGHQREFFPSEFALTSPMVGNINTVTQNQHALGDFLSRVCTVQTDTYVPDDLDMVPRARNAPTPLYSQTLGAGVNRASPPVRRALPQRGMTLGHVPLDGDFSL